MTISSILKSYNISLPSSHVFWGNKKQLITSFLSFSLNTLSSGTIGLACSDIIKKNKLVKLMNNSVGNQTNDAWVNSYKPAWWKNRCCVFYNIDDKNRLESIPEKTILYLFQRFNFLFSLVSFHQHSPLREINNSFISVKNN